MKFEQTWITKSINFEAVKWTEVEGQKLAKKSGKQSALTTSQLRKFFGELRRIESDFDRYKEDVPLLKVRLAYAVGRDKQSKGKNRYKIEKIYSICNDMAEAYEKSAEKDRKENFHRMVKLIESIVAFHKFSGGE